MAVTAAVSLSARGVCAGCVCMCVCSLNNIVVAYIIFRFFRDTYIVRDSHNLLQRASERHFSPSRARCHILGALIGITYVAVDSN